MNEKKKTSKKNSASYTLADLESHFSNGNLAEEGAAELDTQCSIHIHSKRKRLVDADGVSGKAAIDGLVHSGILADDSPEQVSEVTYSQAQSDTEETIIEIYVYE